MGSEIQLRPFSATSEETAKRSAYIGWSPVRLTVIGTNPSGKPNVVRLRSKSLTSGNVQLIFKVDATAEPADEITLDLGGEGRATCFVAGKFQEGKPHNGASPEGKDVTVEAAWEDQPSKIKGSLAFMIRVRRDAQELTDNARDDFTRALAELNDCGKGVYVTDFVAMHVEGADDSQHGDSHFLPWHRLYLLDLERLLQSVNPVVTLPYWRFDQPAPRVFSEDFMGETEFISPATTRFTRGTSGGKMAGFKSTNGLSGWKIGKRNGIERAAFFNTQTDAAPGLPAGLGRTTDFSLISEAKALALGTLGLHIPEILVSRGRGPDFELGFPVSPPFERDRKRDQLRLLSRLPSGFSRMEATPHGAAHVSFNGPINYVPTAPEDPLFFLLHCNVDRLWAMWQFATGKDEPSEYASYPYQNKREVSFTLPSHLTGLFAEDYKVVDALQWPWDDTWSKPYNMRPPGTRSRNFTKSRTGKSIYADMPSIIDAIDAYGYHDAVNSSAGAPRYTNYLGFAYDDVPFIHERTSS